MKKRFLLVLMIAVALLISTASAYALTFQYGGDTVTFDVFDWAPGNALAVGAVPLSTTPTAQTSFDLLYQASLSSFTLGGVGQTATGLNNDYEVTIVAGAREKGYRLQTMDGTVVVKEEATFTWDSDPHAINFFEIYVDDSRNANPLAGTGFNDGTKIIEGEITGGGGNFTVVLNVWEDGEDGEEGAYVPTTPQALDQFNDNDYPTIQTLLGSGNTKAFMTADITTVDSSVILGQLLSLDLNFITDNRTPFETVDPSAQFFDGTVNPVIPTYGDAFGSLVNGSPASQGLADFHFEADARSPVNSQLIPEPGTMFLLGFGLLGITGLARRKRLN